jgi:uncharacterized protein
MFYFREEELSKLAKIYATPKASAVAIYGRRRAGKTELILESFRQSKLPSFYFLCDSDTYQGNLESFVSSFSAFLGIEENVIPAFTKFRQAFHFFVSYLKGKRFLLAIDEFPFIVQGSNGQAVSNEFQSIVDVEMRGSGLTLILCGSNIRFMRNAIENPLSPLYGRFVEHFVIYPFTFEETATLLQDYQPFDQLCAYAATGGVAEYVFFFRDYQSFEQALESLYLSRNGRLLNEAKDIIAMEFRDDSVYSAILKKLAQLPKRAPEISKAIGLETSAVYPYLEHLKSLGVVQEYKTAFPEKQRDTRYYVSDPFFRFSYAFIDPHRSQIGILSPEELFPLCFNEEDTHTFLGHIYEDAVMKSVLMKAGIKGELPFVPTTVLPWVGTLKNSDGTYSEGEIDLVAYDEHNVIVGECKARSQSVGADVFETLREKAGFVHIGERKLYYLLASYSGFKKEALAIKEPDLFLVEKSTFLKR